MSSPARRTTLGRAKAVVTALGLALMLVVGIDYVGFAATGKSMIIGKVNRETTPTTIKRITSGPALSLKTKPNSPPLAVNSQKKVTNLNADKLDGIDSSMLLSAATSIVTSPTPPECQSLDTVGTSYLKIADLGSFTKADAATKVRIDYMTTLSVNIMQGTGVYYQVRIDGKPTTLGDAITLLKVEDFDMPTTISGVFPGLAKGVHTVSVWARSNASTAISVYVDPGCWGKEGNDLYITQFR